MYSIPHLKMISYIMKDFYFDDDVTEDEVKKEVDDWAQSLVHTWYVICKWC